MAQKVLFERVFGWEMGVYLFRFWHFLTAIEKAVWSLLNSLREYSLPYPKREA